MRHALKYIHWAEDSLLAALLLATVVLAGVDIIARLVFEAGTIWIPPVLRILVLWLGLLGALLATRTHEHIAIDIVGRLAPPKIRHLIYSINYLFAAVICLLLAWHSQRFVQMAFAMNDIAFARVPAWPMQLIIPISMGLMSLRFLLQSGLSLSKLTLRDAQ